MPFRGGRALAANTQTLTVGTNIPFTTLDPNTINTSVFPFRNSVFDGLISIPVTDIATYKLGGIGTDLASRYTVNKDYTEIRLTIRDGVTFHDGSKLTPADVAESVRYALDPATGGTMTGSLADITSVKVDGNEVVLGTSAPSVDALYRLTLFRVQSPGTSARPRACRSAPGRSSLQATFRATTSPSSASNPTGSPRAATSRR